jgi:hypothetical protein
LAEVGRLEWRGPRTVPNWHLGKLYLLGGALVLFIVALVTEIAAIVVLHVFPAAAALCCHAGTGSFGDAAGKQAAFFPFIFEGQALAAGCLEVLGGDRCGNWRRVGSLYESRIGAPACSLEGGRIEEALIQGEQTLPDAVGDIIEVACP